MNLNESNEYDDLMYELDENAPPEYKCPITHSLMKDPVIMPDGQTYEREAIRIALNKNPISPITRQPMNINQALTNYALKSLIEKYIQENSKKSSKTKTKLETKSHIDEKLKKIDAYRLKSQKNACIKLNAIIISIVVISLILFIGFTQRQFILTILKLISNSFLDFLNFLGKVFQFIFSFFLKTCWFILTVVSKVNYFIIEKMGYFIVEVLYPLFRILGSQISRVPSGLHFLMVKFCQFVKQAFLLFHKIFIIFLGLVNKAISSLHSMMINLVPFIKKGFCCLHSVILRFVHSIKNLFPNLHSMMINLVPFIKKGFCCLHSVILKFVHSIKNLFSDLYSMMIGLVPYIQQAMKFVGMMLVKFIVLVRRVLCKIIFCINHILNNVYQVLAVEN